MIFCFICVLAMQAAVWYNEKEDFFPFS